MCFISIKISSSLWGKNTAEKTKTVYFTRYPTSRVIMTKVVSSVFSLTGNKEKKKKSFRFAPLILDGGNAVKNFFPRERQNLSCFLNKTLTFSFISTSLCKQQAAAAHRKKGYFKPKKNFFISQATKSLNEFAL